MTLYLKGGKKMNQSLHSFNVYVRKEYRPITFDDLSSCPEKILYPLESLDIYPHPHVPRIFLHSKKNRLPTEPLKKVP